jgi:copper chaperone CopZ
MRRPLGALILLCGLALPAAFPAFASAPPPVDDVTFKILRPGTYLCSVSGLICEACARVIADSVSKVNGVQKASMDFPSRQLTITIADGKEVRLPVIHRALRKAAERIDLGTEFHLTKVRYVP